MCVCVCAPVFLTIFGRFVDTFGNWCLDLLFVKNLGRIYSSVLSHSMCLTPICDLICDPMDCSLLGSSVHGDSPGKNTGVGCHVLLQGIFPTQGLNPDLPHCRQILYHLSHQGSPVIHHISMNNTLINSS